MNIVSGFDIEKAKGNSDLLNLTIEQIKKDFSFFKIELQLTDSDNPYRDLTKKITSELDNLFEKNKKNTFINLLYRIDISEQHILKFKQKNPGYTLNEAISHLIVERELLKVLIRTNYKA